MAMTTACGPRGRFGTRRSSFMGYYIDLTGSSGAHSTQIERVSNMFRKNKKARLFTAQHCALLDSADGIDDDVTSRIQKAVDKICVSETEIADSYGNNKIESIYLITHVIMKLSELLDSSYIFIRLTVARYIYHLLALQEPPD